MSTKFVQTFVAHENISETMKTVAARVNATGSTLTAAANALFGFGEEASKAAVKTTTLRRTIENIDKTAGTVSVGVQSMNKELKSISGASNDAAKSLRKISTDGVPASVYDKLMGWASALHLARKAASSLKHPLQEFSRFEDAATRLAPLTGGLDAAKELCEDLRLEAANGTLSFEQLTSVAGRLSSVFNDTASVRKWTTAFHNLAAGTGMDINELIGNFVKLKAAGRVTAEFPEMFAQKGVNIFGQLSEQTGKTTDELRKMAAAGTLSFAEFEKAILAISTGTGQFAGQAAKMSNTFGGSVGTMVASWNILMANLAQPIAETLTPILQKISGLLQENASLAESAGTAIVLLGKITLPFVGVALAVKMMRAMHTAAQTAKVKLKELFAASEAGFAKMSAQAGTAGAKVGGIGNAAGKSKASVLGLCTGIGALITVVAELALTGFVAYTEHCTEAAEKLSNANKRLGDALGAMDTAKSREEFDRAKKSAEGVIEILERSGKAWADSAGMSFNLNLDSTREAIRLCEKRRASEFALYEIQNLQSEHDAEMAPLLERRKKLQEEIDKLKLAARLESTESVHEKIKIELEAVGFNNLPAFNATLSALEQKTHLTEEENARSKELLATKQKIDSLEKSAAAARASLREKVQLMQAELAGNDKLLALKEKLYRADLRSQFLKAGVSADKVEEQVQKYIELEKQLEAKRKRESADKATAADDAELDILKAKAAGDEKRAKQLERERKELEHIRKLEEQGVPAEEAKRRARERANAELSIEEQKLDSVAAKNERAAATFEVRTARGTETRTVQDVPAMRAVPAGTRTGNAGDAAGIGQTVGKSVGQTLVDINIAIRDNTRGILDVLRRGISPQKVLVNPVLS